MKAKLLISLVVILLAFGFAGCSGGGNMTPPGPPFPPQVSISVSPTSATVQSGQTQQFTATITGSSNTVVAWSASAGTISSSGLFTAPATSSNISATITGTAQADPTKSAQATVTVTPPPPPPTPTTTSAVSTITNLPFIWLPNPGATTVKLLGAGFASTDTQTATPTIPFTTRLFVNATEFDLGLGFDNAHFRTGFYTLTDCNANCSNPPAPFTFLGDSLSRLSMGTDGRFCMRDAEAVACFNADRSSAGSPFAVGNGAGGIAFDSANNFLAVAGSGAGPVGLYDITNPTGHFGAANVSGSVKGIAQKNGTGCVAQPTEGVVTMFPVDPTLNTSVSSSPGAAGTQPWSVDMAQIGMDLECVSISADLNLTRFSTADGSLKGSLAITGLTSGGTPRVVTFNSGSATGTAAVLSPTDNIIVFVTLGTMTEIRRVTVAPSAISHIAQIMTDETAGNLIIVIANVNGSTTMSSFAKLAIASGNLVPYTGPNSTATLLFMDVAVSPISPNIIGGSLGQNTAIPVQ